MVFGMHEIRREVPSLLYTILHLVQVYSVTVYRSIQVDGKTVV